MSGQTMGMLEAHQREREAQQRKAAAYLTAMNKRPKLSAETAVDYLDWLTQHLTVLPESELQHHFTAAELAVRVHMGNAQGKATQHTLVEQGIIEPPPAAS